MTFFTLHCTTCGVDGPQLRRFAGVPIPRVFVEVPLDAHVVGPEEYHPGPSVRLADVWSEFLGQHEWHEMAVRNDG